MELDFLKAAVVSHQVFFLIPRGRSTPFYRRSYSIYPGSEKCKCNSLRTYFLRQLKFCRWSCWLVWRLSCRKDQLQYSNLQQRVCFWMVAVQTICQPDGVFWVLVFALEAGIGTNIKDHQCEKLWVLNRRYRNRFLPGLSGSMNSEWSSGWCHNFSSIGRV